MVGKEASLLQEKYIARKFGGKLPSNSGGTKFGAGDILLDEMLIEAKTTTKEKISFSIKKEWLDKAKEQAYEQGKSRHALAFRFEPTGDDYFVLSEKQFEEYVELLRESF